ncbi:MAG: efflux RND transporter permease subunit [Chloroflexi bacterium]|nr:efflux RND transporter permease subunit [Chloroflexota bacterium]
MAEQPPERMWLSDLSIRQPHLITMLMVAAIVVGALFYSRMGLDLLPDISLPIVAVRTVYPGASPSEVERSVSRPLEDAVVSLNGVESVRSTSRDGVSIVIVEFQLERDAKAAADDVRTRVGAVRNALPADVKEPLIERFDPSAAPILSVAVSDTSGKRSPEQLRTLVDDALKPRLERVPGVGSVEATGGRVREVHVDLQRDRLEALGVAPQQVIQAVRGENVDVPGGRVVEGAREQVVKTAGQFRSLEELGAVPVPTARGASVQLKDMADVSDGYADVRALRRLDGQDAVVATIQKQSGTNTVAVAEAVKRELPRIRQDYPDLGVVAATDQSEFTREAVSDVQLSMLLGGLLAALVVFAFFRDWRNTLVTVAGLPVIVLGTFAAMHALGMGLNMLTLMALSLSIGMLIDDAIVVRENIFRHMETGEEPWVAAQRGTAEIALAVLAVSSTIVAVFLPIAFASGIVGKLLRDFGLTVALAVLLSLVEAFTLAPMLSAHFFKRIEPHQRGQRAGRVERLFRGLDAGYRRLLGWALRHRLLALGVGLALFFASLGVVPLMPRTFVPETDQGAFEVGVELPPGARLEATDRAARQLEAILRRRPEVAHVFTTVGSEDGGVGKAALQVKLVAKGHGLTQQVVAAVRPELEAATRGARLSVAPASATQLAGGGTVISALRGRPIQFSLQGASYQDLDAASLQVMAALQEVPGAVDVDRSIQPGQPGVAVVVDRPRAADLGVSAAQVGSTVRALVNGERAGGFQTGDREVDVIVRLQAADRASADDLLRLPITAGRGVLVPLASMASAVPSTEPAAIERQDRQRQVLVGAGYLGRSQGAVVADARAAVAGLRLPPGVTARIAGQERFTDDAFSSVGLALGLAILFVYMILASQFASFIHPLTIMLALPFSVVGALLALFGAGKALDLLAMIGLILLLGLVTKNSILLVDFTNQLKRRGRSTREALLEAGPIRLRPILMTTLAMIFGMVPVAAGVGAGAELRQSMGIGVIGGLLTSTVLTLVAVPVAYSLIDDLVGLVRRSHVPGVAPASAMHAARLEPEESR